jgi:hypothetical protein
LERSKIALVGSMGMAILTAAEITSVPVPALANDCSVGSGGSSIGSYCSNEAWAYPGCADWGYWNTCMTPLCEQEADGYYARSHNCWAEAFNHCAAYAYNAAGPWCT